MPIRLIFKKLCLYVFLPICLILIGAAASSVLLINTAKEVTTNSDWYSTPNGIDDEFYTVLGNHQQYVRIRGRDRSNPVLVYLHGGPGGDSTEFSYRLLRPLTDYFTIVEWDQRGAGKSHIDDSLLPTMTYSQMVSDTIELIESLRSRLNINKVILMGQSWGSMLGIGVIKKRPDLITAYVGTGQAVAWNAGFDEVARLALVAATAANDETTISELKALPKEWPPTSDQTAFSKRISVIHKAASIYGKNIHAVNDYEKPVYGEFNLDTLLSPRNTLSELLFPSYSTHSATTTLMKDLHHKDLRTEFGTEYKVPMFIFQGEHDWITPTSLVKPWFESLNAPHKEYVAFEHSAHLMLNEESGKFLYELVSRVRPMALK